MEAMDLLSRVTEDFGELISVSASLNFPANPGHSIRFSEYTFRFENGTLRISAEPDYDTIGISEGEGSFPHVFSLTHQEPWSTVIGYPATWAWLMTNSRGFTDGVQIEFGKLGSNWTVQFMCEASALTTRTFDPIEQWSPPLTES